jgi:serine protease Do
VVNISVSGRQKTAAAIDPNDPMFEFFPSLRHAAPQERGPARGMGSGFIVSADG